MSKKIFALVIVIGLLIFSFLPVWEKSLSLGGSIKINTWQKFFMRID